MKRLIIMRHGEAVPPGTCNDHARSLTARGHQQASDTAALIKEKGWVPEAVIYSDARRTKETFDDVNQSFGVDLAQEIETSRLYLAGPDRILEEMAAVSDQVETVMLIGHNPGWSEAVGVYSGEYEGLGTAEACLLEIDDQSWMSALARRLEWTFVEKLGA